MLGSFRKFKSSIFAKVFLIIVAVPFIFWGMGPVFQGTKLTKIATVGNNKIYADEFIQYVKRISENNNIEFNKNQINELFSKYIGEQLIKYEMEELRLNISEDSLAQIIKNEKIFQKENIFARTKYEKFLIEHSINAKTFENNILNQEKKNQFFEFVGGGLLPPKFVINANYKTENQKRNIKLIDLNEISKVNTNITSKEIKDFYNQHKLDYNQIYKTIKFVNLTPKALTGDNEFNNLFFEKIDEIEDFIIEGQNLDFLIKRYNLEKIKTLSFDSQGISQNLEKINQFDKDFINKIFTHDESEKTFITQNIEDYFVIEIIKTENVQKNMNDVIVQKDIKDKLVKKYKTKLISELINKINDNKFTEKNFYEFSKNKNIKVKEVKINNVDDIKILNKTIVKQIYKHPNKKVILAGSKNLEEIFLIYINSVENVSLTDNSKRLDEYLIRSKVNLINSLYGTYDIYLKNKYPIEINYNVLDNIKDYFQ